MVEGTVGSHHKEGSTKMKQTSTIAAGIDVAKEQLDVAGGGDVAHHDLALAAVVELASVG